MEMNCCLGLLSTCLATGGNGLKLLYLLPPTAPLGVSYAKFCEHDALHTASVAKPSTKRLRLSQNGSDGGPWEP